MCKWGSKVLEVAQSQNCMNDQPSHSRNGANSSPGKMRQCRKKTQADAPDHTPTGASSDGF